MRRGFLVSMSMAAAIASGLVGFAAVSVRGQGAAKQGATVVKIVSAAPNVPIQNPHSPNRTPAPRNADGHLDLDGMWEFQTTTPMQRDKALGAKLFYTPEEADALQKRVAAARNTDVRNANVEVDAYQRGMNNVWFDYDYPMLQNRTSLVVDPPDGQIPALTPAVKASMQGASTTMGEKADTAKDRSLRERCLSVGSGPPYSVDGWVNPVLIIQRKNYVILQTEKVHTTRFVWLDGRPHTSSVPQWSGDARGHWEGDTLIIETTNFRPDANWFGVRHPEKFTLVERLTRIDGGTVMYEYTMNDPETWTAPWTVQMPMRRWHGQLFEYACHEGNRGLYWQLSAARAEEAKAQQATPKK